MPFTFSHTAFSLLFYKQIRTKKLSATGLILGCMAPDFEYFLRMKMQGDWGHQWWGMLFLDVPMAFCIALLFHTYIRDVLICYAPSCLKIRCIQYYQLNWLGYLKQHFIQVIISILLGILSHVLWDAFTHPHGYFVQHFAVLQQDIQLGSLHLPFYKIGQHGSSILGLLLVVIYLYKLPKSMLTPSLSGLRYRENWGGILLCFSCSSALWAWINPDLMWKIGHVVVASIACLFWSILVMSIYMMRKKKTFV